MANRAEDWLAQAEHDLEMAEAARDVGRHEWSCFASHQAAEKSVKAIHLLHGQDAWGHDIGRLLDGLPVAVPQEVREQARVLDGMYIPTRYPDSYPEGTPAEHFGTIQSEDAIGYARTLIAFAHSALAQQG